MMKSIRHNYLQKRFLAEIIVVLLIITLFFGIVQFTLLKEQKDNQIEMEATMIAQGIQHGIVNSRVASKSVEHQINLKLISMAQLIARDLQGKEINAITNQELESIRSKLELSGITLFAKVNGEIKGVRATDPKEIGFSFKEFGYEKVFDDLLHSRKPILEADIADTNIIALPVAQSGSHTDEPTFFKYVYYHPPGAPYFINVYTEANEVYQVTQEVGPEKWIQNFYQENSYVKEIGVLNLRVIRNPDLETKLYPPLKKVEYGSYRLEDPQDKKILLNMSAKENVSLLQHGPERGRTYKMFLPVSDDHVIYISFDYDKMIQSLYNNSTVHFLSFLVSLIALFIMTTRYFSKIKQAEEKIKFMAYHDELTNLPNRRLLKEKVAGMISNSNGSTPIGILFLDLDNFKYINDTFGHSHGDQLIQSVAYRLKALLNPGETVARMGGDEFVILLPMPSGVDQAQEKARSILKTFESPFHISSKEVYVRPSIGISCYPTDAQDIEDLIKYADTAMYYAKKRGRNNFQLYSSNMMNNVQQKVYLENQLRTALVNREFMLHYQPKINIATGSVIGVEALIRWNHPEKGVIPPKEFIPFAEESDLIIPIGDWVLREAAKQIKVWSDMDGFPSIRVSVNLSARQFFNLNMMNEIKAILNHSDIDPSHLEIEITESALIDDSNAAIKIIHEMRKLGIRVSMDDFGTGYSSMNSLKLIPIDTLKIDRSFLRDINKGKRDMEILRTIISLGKNLDLEVIAEGVETKEQLDILRTLGCDHVQGYLFGKPVSPKEIEKMVRTRLNGTA